MSHDREHQVLDECMINRLEQHGIAVLGTVFREEGPAATDQGVPYGQPTEPIIVGNRETLTPGEIIATAAIAVEDGQGITVVTPTQADARWVTDILHKPFVDTTDDWVEFYRIPGHYWATENSFRLASGKPEEGAWQYHPDGRLRYQTDGKIYAIGQADQPLSTFNARDRFCRIDLDMHKVFIPGKDQPEIFAMPKAVADYGWPVELPAVPNRPHYAGPATVVYWDGDTLVPYQRVADWAGQSPYQRNNESARSYLSTYLHPIAGREIPFSTVRPRYLHWFSGRCRGVPPEDDDIDRKLNKLHRRRRPEDIDDWASDALAGCEWRTPSDLEIPVLNRIAEGPPDGSAHDLAQFSAHGGSERRR